MRQSESAFRHRRVGWLVLAAIVAVAIFLRFHRLEALPPGLDRDAAGNGVYALNWLRRGVWPFFINHMGAPDPLMVYLQAGAIALLGVDVVALRVVSAGIGALTVLALYLFSRELFAAEGPVWARRGALVAAFGLATSLIHVHLSRYGLRAILLPLFELVLLFAFWKGWRTGGRWCFLLAGLALGLSQYSYLAARALPLLLAALLAHQALWRRPMLRRRLEGLGIVAGVAGIVLIPLLWYFAQYPQAAFYRASQVTLLDNPEFQELGIAGKLGRKLVGQLLMFGISWSGQYNVLAQPLLDPVFFLAFLIGLVVALINFRRAERAWPVLLLVIMLLPDLIGGDRPLPHELRTIGVIPAAYHLAALGVITLWRWAEQRVRRLPAVLVGLALAFSLVTTYRTYFVTWDPTTVRDELLHHWSEVMEARFINTYQGSIYVPLIEFSHPVVRYLTSRRVQQIVPGAPPLRGETDSPAAVLMPANPYKPRVEGPAYVHDPALFVRVEGNTAYLLPPLRPSAAEMLNRLLARQPPAGRIETPLGDVAASWWELDADSASLLRERVAVESPLGVSFGGGIELIGYTLEQRRVHPGDEVGISLFWRASHPVSKEYTLFIHILDRAERVWSWGDVAPAMGVYPTTLWRPGEIVTTHHRLPLPDDAPAGRYVIEMGLYEWLNLRRLPVQSADGQPLGNRMLLGPIKVLPSEPLTPDRVPRQIQANLGEQVLILGYDFTVDDQAGTGEVIRIAPGQTLTLGLYWQGLTPMDTDYTVFVHLADATEKIIAQWDGQPRSGRYPTSIWDPGEVVSDRVTLTVPPETSPGSYRLWTGMYVLETGARLPLVGRPGEDRVRLATVEIGQ